MIIICGNTLAEVERDLELAKSAIATGAPMGVGGATMADVEQALRGLREAVGSAEPTIDNPNYDPEDIEPWVEDEDECECGCTHCDCEDEETKPTFIEWLNDIGAPDAVIRLAQDLGLE